MEWSSNHIIYGIVPSLLGAPLFSFLLSILFAHQTREHQTSAVMGAAHDSLQSQMIKKGYERSLIGEILQNVLSERAALKA